MVVGELRARFAPSPTGYLHVGGVRTALFAWLVARGTEGGKFILRIEDTDKSREVSGSEQHISDCLSWLGLDWDEGPGKGDFGPYRQSERLDIYKKWGQKLIDSGRAYADPNSPQQLDELRQAAKAAKKPFLFRDHRPDNPPAWDGTHPLRFKSEPRVYKWHDEVLGSLSAGPESVDDFILIKSDGYPTYNFAHVIDDHLMQVSHVIRSQEFLPSVPKFLNLYEALQIERPLLATLPYVMGPDGNKKLSKRDGAKDILDYKREGYLPESLVNFLVTLGWNDGTEQEIFSIDELIAKFQLDKVQRSGARFDEQRLIWMNGHYIRQKPLAELVAAAEAYWPPEASEAAAEYKTKILALVQERLKYFAELSELSRFFFTEPDAAAVKELFLNPVDKKLKGMSPSEISSLLKTTFERLGDSDFSQEDISKRLNGLLEELGTKPGILFASVRIAVTGASSSPELFGTLGVLGKDKSLSRLEKAIAVLAN